MTRSTIRSSRQSVSQPTAPRRPHSRRRGFTLTEVLLVLAILGVIAAMVVPNLLGRQKDALVKSTKMSIKSMQDACEQYAIAHDGELPQGGRDEVVGLLTNPGADNTGKLISPYLRSIPKDAWDQPLHYEYLLVQGRHVAEHNPLNPKYRLFIKMWQRLPLPLANLIGPHIVKNLG